MLQCHKMAILTYYHDPPSPIRHHLRQRQQITCRQGQWKDHRRPVDLPRPVPSFRNFAALGCRARSVVSPLNACARVFTKPGQLQFRAKHAKTAKRGRPGINGREAKIVFLLLGARAESCTNLFVFDVSGRLSFRSKYTIWPRQSASGKQHIKTIPKRRDRHVFRFSSDRAS